MWQNTRRDRGAPMAYLDRPRQFDRLLWRRLRILAALADAPGTVARLVLMRAAGFDLYGPTPETSARLFYSDLAWLRYRLGADIVWRDREGGYELLSLPEDMTAICETLAQWKGDK
jgi:hypothetical protein